jgi:hypothetical protein
MDCPEARHFKWFHRIFRVPHARRLPAILFPVLQLRAATIRTGAMRAAEDLALSFDAMTDDLATAVWTGGRERMDGAFEAVECMRLPSDDHVETLIVVISANFTLRHMDSGFELWDSQPAELV